jgi:hypothetical protein
MLKKCKHKIGVSDVMDHISFEFYTEDDRLGKDEDLEFQYQRKLKAV